MEKQRQYAPPDPEKIVLVHPMFCIEEFGNCKAHRRASVVTVVCLFAYICVISLMREQGMRREEFHAPYITHHDHDTLPLRFTSPLCAYHHYH